MALPGLAAQAARLLPADPLWRRLTVIRLADSAGRGVFISGSILYFTLHAGLSARVVGFGLSTAAASGMLGAVALGAAADRVDRRRLLSATFVAMAVSLLLYPLVHGAVAFFGVMVAVGFFEYGTSPVEDALMITVVPAEDRVRLKAMMRTVFNLGFSLGTAVAAIAAAGTGLLTTVPLGAAALMLATSVLVRGLPRGTRAAGPAGRRGRLVAVRDLPFLRVIGISAVLALHASLVLAVLPLWALERTSIPHSLIPALMIVNTVVVVLFQVRISRDVNGVTSATRTAQRSGYLLAAGCLIASTTAFTAAGGNRLLVAVILIVAVLVFSLAEITQSASGWALAFALAPDHAQGEYLGAFELHFISQNVAGPAALSALVIAYGFWGWVGLAALMLAAAAAAGPVLRSSAAIMEARRSKPITVDAAAQ